METYACSRLSREDKDIVTVNRINQFTNATMRSPIVWGLLLTLGFYLPIEAGVITDANIIRYFAGHWVEYIETAAFFVGLAALAIKALDVAGQFTAVGEPILSEPPFGGQSINACGVLLEEIETAERRHGPGYLHRRLRNALSLVMRKGSPETLDGEIKYLSDMDAAQAAQSYGFVKIIIWAIPILGFLGTVIGITMAIAGLNPKQLEESLPEVTAGLGTAFDTTAIALGFSMVLMFVQFLVDKLENRLLVVVDDRVNIELVGRFRAELAPQDPLMMAVKRMVDAVLPNTERLVIRQTELWQSTIEAANRRWTAMSEAAGKQLESALAGALTQTMKQHATQVLEGEAALAEQNRTHWSKVQQAMEQTSENLSEQQAELVRQGEVLLKVVEATGQIGELEKTLNRNLHALAGSKNFEETVISLAAAIQLLTTRLHLLPNSDARTVELGRTKVKAQAA
jgi:hypothetical protein